MRLKLLAQALKKARQFEVGKLKRRLKAVEGADTAKLDAQLAALAEIDLDATAQQVDAQGSIVEGAIPKQRVIATASALGLSLLHAQITCNC